MAWSNSYIDVKRALTCIDEEKTIIFYDTETTGLDKQKDRIIQFSALKCSLPNFDIMDTIDLYIRCPFSVPDAASDVNNITDDMLDKLGIDEYDAFLKIKAFLSDADILSGFNIERFDNLMMKSLYARYKEDFTPKMSVDVYPLAKKVIPPDDMPKTKSGYPSYKQMYCIAYYDKSNDTQFGYHSAIEDVKATRYLLMKMIDDVNAQIAEASKKESENTGIIKRNANIIRVSLFSPSRKIDRIYIDTDQGKFFYDNAKKVWNAKPGQGNTDAIDMTELKNKLLDFFGVTDDKSFYSAARSAKEVYFNMWVHFSDGEDEMSLLIPAKWIKNYIEAEYPKRVSETWNEKMKWYDECAAFVKWLRYKPMDTEKMLTKALDENVIIRKKIFENQKSA